MTLFERILATRNIDAGSLTPDYDRFEHDPFLMPDMDRAVQRIIEALKRQETVTIYGDYDVDGLTATALLYRALTSIGFRHVNTFVPNRFVEGFGLSAKSVQEIIKNGTSLIITVDCGSTNMEAVAEANRLGGDVIITDHHSVLENLPEAVAVVNPKRSDNKYPFRDLAGVGVAFKVLQALQTTGDNLPKGQEKWFLDLVALGTVCDSVDLIDENRANVYWGLRVLRKTRSVGLEALMKVSNVNVDELTSRSLGFVLGPRMNASGRMETAEHSLDMLLAQNRQKALDEAYLLDDLNSKRRLEQDRIFQEAIEKAEECHDPVLILSNKGWSHGVVGIVASKLLEKYQKPVFVMEEMDDVTKGSARSYGDFDLSKAIEASRELVTGGGGHKLAAGVTMPTKNVEKFRLKINEFYRQSGLILNQQRLQLLPVSDAEATLDEIDEQLINDILQLEPFGSGNLRPIISTTDLKVRDLRRMGAAGQHVKLCLEDKMGVKQFFIAFNAPANFFAPIGSRVDVWYQPDINQWNGIRTIESKIVHLEQKQH